ncbi:MAG TPA: divalent-cation tolerance protein CutA [Myxococcales bacterium]|jgi:periplasmic divalent cation tolerance protein|nr:divalent-cation tolerance protein CutA [Myxococcales bacterium]
MTEQTLAPEAPLVVMVTAPSAEKASEIARVLVEERLAACANLVGPIRSIYRWQGKVEDEAEVLLLLKTRVEVFERLRERVVGLHEYSCPEVVALPIVRGHEPYLQWLGESVG